MSARPGRLLGLFLLASVGLMACAPAPATVTDGAASPPRRAWVPEESPRAVILALHGFNDYSNAFAEFGVYAAGKGVAVHAYDQRGFGANPDAGAWPGTEVLIADLVRERARLAAEYPGRPIYLLGDSMGAAVIIAAHAQGASLDVAGRILVAPAVWGGDQLNPFYRATLWLASHLLPGLRVTGDGLAIRPSDNEEMLRALGADPLVIKETRVATLAGLVELMDVALAGAPSLPGPLLVLGGARDEIVPPEAHQAMLERLRAEPCTSVIYPDGYHMLLRDLQRQVVWDDILAWLDGRPLPSGLAEPCGTAAPEVAALPG